MGKKSLPLIHLCVFSSFICSPYIDSSMKSRDWQISPKSKDNIYSLCYLGSVSEDRLCMMLQNWSDDDGWD